MKIQEQIIILKLHVTYFNQDVKNEPEFKKWYNNLKEEINKYNLERNRGLLAIGFCMNCMSYTICSIMDFSYCYAYVVYAKNLFVLDSYKIIIHAIILLMQLYA